MANKQGKMVSVLIAVQLGTHVANIQVLAKSRKAFKDSSLYSVYFLTSGIDQLPHENNFD